jgi:septum formation protein
MTDLYLASKSPRRRELLAQIGVQYQVLEIDVEEVRGRSESPIDYVSRLACAKSQAGYEALELQGLGKAPVLGADTVVVLGSEVLEKPCGKAEGLAMLRTLSARTHEVVTAVAVTLGGRQTLRVSSTEVSFRVLDDDEIERYWNTGEPHDKAGGYGIQGLAAVFVENICGSYSGVVGLPLAETQKLLEAFDVPYW